MAGKKRGIPHQSPSSFTWTLLELCSCSASLVALASTVGDRFQTTVASERSSPLHRVAVHSATGCILLTRPISTHWKRQPDPTSSRLLPSCNVAQRSTRPSSNIHLQTPSRVVHRPARGAPWLQGLRQS
eukprot:scaffold116_cov334-Pavlova_lutheri.AAC.17